MPRETAPVRTLFAAGRRKAREIAMHVDTMGYEDGLTGRCTPVTFSLPAMTETYLAAWRDGDRERKEAQP